MLPTIGWLLPTNYKGSAEDDFNNREASSERSILIVDALNETFLGAKRRERGTSYT